MLLFGHYTLTGLLSAMIVLFFGMGIHEFAHAWVADYWGDPTPRQNNKLTLNPLAHIDWYGWLMIMLIGFGTAGSVAINPSRMRDPRWGNFWTSLAGPLSHLVQALVFGILFRLFGNMQVVSYMLVFDAEPWEIARTGIGMFPALVSQFLYIGIWFNVMLFFFNLLPFFPLDGYRVVQSMLPGYWLSGKQIPEPIRKNAKPVSRFLQQPAYVWTEWQQITTYIFMGLILLSFAARSTGLWQIDILGHILRGPVAGLISLLGGG